MKQHTFDIPPHAQGGKLYAYARRMLPDVPEYVLREAFQKRDVKVDGQRVNMSAAVVPGAHVQIYTRDVQPKESIIPIVYEDEQVLVAAKPSGISCEADPKGGRTLPQLLHAQMLQTNPAAEEPLLCHRLDNPTEGLIVLAKSAAAQQALQNGFRQRRIRKEYTCIVRGTPDPPHRVLRDWLIKDARRAEVRIVPTERPGAKNVITEYTVLQSGECAKLRILLHTGRTHQIRAHMAFIGHPLLGDDQYGDRAFNRAHKARQLMLCSSRLHFELEGDFSYLNAHSFTCTPSF